ncbi:DUF2191 domain-containing protein [Aureimonas endophytica]|uniref:DUF2191 domain-containing protein n=1 Tax=Aureimonas endophytica TaxID=2027858 RepID=A0A917E0K2_9HYPH|nr:type II toxin-antitoxin system VapB family antitoxin [Aureimonas endophytica]GGD85717.1 DUF2191 domain-containing protein [Aureimonas endophytica]
MAITTVEIDENLLREAMELTNSDDARRFIEEHLQTLVKRRIAQRELMKLRGKIEWVGDLDEMRRG